MKKKHILAVLIGSTQDIQHYSNVAMGLGSYPDVERTQFISFATNKPEYKDYLLVWFALTH